MSERILVEFHKDFNYAKMCDVIMSDSVEIRYENYKMKNSLLNVNFNTGVADLDVPANIWSKDGYIFTQRC